MSPTTLNPYQRIWYLDLPRGRRLVTGERPLVMGVVNLTPDSFSDGGRFGGPEAAVEHARQMSSQGADIIDLGAESSRPGGGVYGEGAADVDADLELERLLPVLDNLRTNGELVISVDTRKAAVARRALAHGADLINDVSGLADPELGEVVAQAGCPLVVMHSRGELSSMQDSIAFEDVVTEVTDELRTLCKRAESCKIPFGQLIVDPGLGFGKATEHNLELLRNLDCLATLDRPMLVGPSRKSFIGEINDRPADQRLPGSLAAIAWAARHRAAIVRVHDVDESARFLEVWNAVNASRRNFG